MLRKPSLMKIITTSLFLIFGLAMLNATFAERTVLFVDPSELGPMTYPRYLIIVWLGLTVLYFFKRQRPFDHDTMKQAVPILIKTVLCIVLYTILFQYIGLFASTALFLLCFLPTMGIRKPLKVIFFSLLCAAITWVLFIKVLGLSMPPNYLLDFIS